MANIYDEAWAYAEKFNKDTVIGICKHNEDNWGKNIIEIATEMIPPYIIFKIDVYDKEDPNKLFGCIKEIWYWDENYAPTPVVYPSLSEWQIGENIIVVFNNDNEEFDGHLIKE